MDIQNRHMECGESYICHDLVLDQNVNYNAYLPPLLHEALDVDKKWQCWELVCITIHFQIFLCNIRIILNMILSVCSFYFTGSFSILSLINDSMFPMIFRQMFLELFSQTYIIVLCAIMH